MKLRILIILFCLNSVLLIAQKKEEYYSSEEKAYYLKQANEYEYFNPEDKDVILNKIYYGITIKELENFKPYNGSNYLTPYQDSIMSIETREIDSFYFPVFELYAKIGKWDILKHEKSGNFEAFIYVDYKYENVSFGEQGIWIAISKDFGKTWKYFYTGLANKQNLYLKWYSEIPLIKNENKIQIEASILQQISPFSHPGPGAEYKLIKDGIIAEFDLDIISADNDSDGLTNIVEKKFMTNPETSDTDLDGILDSFDLNPRFGLKKNEITALYEYILGEELNINFEDTLISFEACNKTHYVNDTTITVMIVTDDENIMSIQSPKYRTIIIRSNEYEIYKNKNVSLLNDYSLSPLFKVDGLKETYKIYYSFATYSGTYLVKKTKKGWLVRPISAMIA